MGSGMGAPEEELNRQAELQQQRLQQMSDGSQAVAGSDPDRDGEISTDAVDAEDMIAQYEGRQKKSNMSKKKVKRKSPRYSDVPAYSLDEIDMDTLREEVFDQLEFTPSEKQVAGAIAKNDVSDMTQSDIADLAGVSKKIAGDVVQMLETRSSPTENQREVLRVARENPDATQTEIGEVAGKKAGNLRRILVPYRHERIVCEVEEEAEEETTEEREEKDDQDASDGGDTDDDSDQADAVQKDLDENGEATYKYDPKEKSKSQTRGGQSLKKVRDQSHLISLFRELDRRTRELENSERKEGVPNEIKGRISSLESQVEGMQSVVDRIEDQQTNLERFVEDELGGDQDLESIEGEVQYLKGQLENVTESLSSHKEAIEDLSGGETSRSTEFSTEEKRKVIVALAENGQDDLIDRVLDEF